MQSNELPQLREAIEQAIPRNEASVDWRGTQVPASEKTLAAIDELARADGPPDVGEAVARDDNGVEKTEGERRRVLRIAWHFEDVTYRRTLQPRKNPLTDGPPAFWARRPSRIKWTASDGCSSAGAREWGRPPRR